MNIQVFMMFWFKYQNIYVYFKPEEGGGSVFVRTLVTTMGYYYPEYHSMSLNGCVKLKFMYVLVLNVCTN
jgi:hypothetical protein